MKTYRWTPHALVNLAIREVTKEAAERVIANPDFTIADPPDREIRMGRFYDPVLDQEMLLRVVIEETAAEIVVVTVYKTSQFRKYLRGLV
jgi:hypothetical protein